MAFSIPSVLRIRTLEQQQVALMLATGFFMGVFIATYQITADSIFLNRMVEYLDKAFLVAGILGIVSTVIFSWLQNRIRFSVLTQISVALILAYTIAVYILLNYGEPAWQSIVVFTMYCSSGPIIALLLLSYWGTFGRLFNFRQSKSIIGWIDTGQLIAAIIASFLIPLTGKLLPDTADYLMVCCVSMLALGGLLFIISTRFTLSKNDPREFDEMVRKETTMRKTFSDRYIILMSTLLMISMIAFILNQFAFQQMVQVQYPDQRELTDFNAFFMAAVYGISLFMQTFINNRIIGNYGLRVSLLILPLVLGVLSIGSLIAGYFFGFDKATSPTGFIYFFLFVAMTRMFNWTLRDSLETPVFKLFFIPLDGRLRFNIQSKVEGIVNESARFVAGLLIFGVAFLPFFKVIHISIGLALIAGIYFSIVNRLHAEYKNKIRLKLETSDNQQDKLERGFAQVTRRLEEQLLASRTGKAVFSFKLLEKIDATQLSNWVNSLIKNSEEGVHHYAQERLNQIKGLSVSDKYVISMDKDHNDPSKNVLSKADLQMIIQNDGDITKARIQKLARSVDADDRQYAAELLLHTETNEGVSFLIELLNDSESKVRNTAIRSSIKKWNAEVLNALIENLGNPIYNNQAMNALVLIGQKTLPYLDSAFYRSSQSTQVIIKLIQAMGKIGGQRAKDILWNKIDYPNKVVVSQVLLSLGECGFKAGISQITRIKYAIENDIADIRWNLGAIQEIGEESSFNKQIVRSLRWEIQNDIDHIYMLLAMLYDTRSIQLVKENIDSATTEGIAFAVELLDVFLSDQLKQRVIPILDELTDAERIGKLDVFYPRVKLDSKLVLKFIINRDYSQSNRWTKACTLYQIGILKISDFKLDLIAQMFNPDRLIREVAAWALYQINQEEYHKNVNRLGEAEKRILNDVIVSTQRLSEFAEVLFFQRIEMLKEIPGITLSYLADISDEIRVNEGESIILDDKSNNDFFIVAKGKLDLYQKGEFVAEFLRGQFIGEMLGKQNFLNTNLVLAKTEVRILKFNKDKFYELLSDNVKLAGRVLEFA